MRSFLDFVRSVSGSLMMHLDARICIKRIQCSSPGGEGGASTETERGNATSYRAAVTNGDRQFEDRNGGNQGRYQGTRGGDKGKGIAKNKQVPYKHEDLYHPYREKFSRGNGEGSSAHGRYADYGDRRKGTQARGPQQSRASDEDRTTINPEKLMFEAFKGAPPPNVMEPSQTTVVAGNGSTSKACKELVFEDALEPIEMASAQPMDEPGELKNLELQVVDGEESKVAEEALHSQALDEANLMIEGVRLSDSELLLEDGDEVEDWEQGEIVDFTEEQDVSMVGQGSGTNDGLPIAKAGEENLVEKDGQMEGDGANTKKKKSGQIGTEAPGGVKKR